MTSPGVDYGQLHTRDGAPRVKGGSGILFVVDGTDWWADVTSCRFTQDKDYMRNANRQPIVNLGQWKAQITAIQSTSPGSLWRFLWDNPTRDADVVYAPHGNTTPTDEKPFFYSVAFLPSAPDVGGDAGEDIEYTFDTVLPLAYKPRLITDPGDLPGGQQSP